MMRALNTAGTGMVAQQFNLDIIANNLANVNTTGFKSQRAEFQDMVYQSLRASGASAGGAATTPEPVQVGLGSKFSASAASFAAGAFQNTGNALDIAIAGDGFFQVEMPDGTTAYTRDGAFKVDANGLVVSSDGYALVPNITIPTGASQPTISPTGQVSVTLPGQEEPSELGTLELAVFPNPAGLTRIGQNLYRAGGASGSPSSAQPGQQGAGTLQQFVVEASNVQIVEEMVRMITTQRAYEINSKAVQTADDMLGILNNLKR